jgi:hypothetical protein
MSETKTQANHKIPGWLAPVAVIAALSLGGWFVWSQFNSGPSTSAVRYRTSAATVPQQHDRPLRVRLSARPPARRADTG